MVEPTYQQLIGMPDAWSPATHGAITAEPIIAEEPNTLEEFESKRGKFTGKVLLCGGPPSQLHYRRRLWSTDTRSKSWPGSRPRGSEFESQSRPQSRRHSGW